MQLSICWKWAGAVAVSIFGVAAPAFAQDANKDPLLLDMVWRAQISPGDFMDTLSRAEFNNFPASGLSYYLPAANRGGYEHVYRHRNNTSGQHLPSNFTPIAGRALEGRIGYAFPSAGSMGGGLTPLERLHNASTGDRFLALPGETRTGYTTQPMNGYGWARNLTNNENQLSLSSGGVTIESNLNAGGSLWNWTHNGKQYVNTRDYGRQIQSAYIAQNDRFKDANGNNRYINPTEGGTRHTDLAIPAARRQGSPLISAFNAPDGKTQSTRTAALDWDPNLFGGDADHPVYFPGTVLGKNITLNYQSRGAVAKYETVLRVPYAATTGAIEIPTGYLNADFNRFYTYEAGFAAGARLDEVNPPLGTEFPYNVQFTPESDYGGVIISTADQQHAMGVYGATVDVGGSIDYFTLFDFTHLGGTSETSGGTSKFSAVYGPDHAFGRSGDSPTLKVGYEYTFTSWLMTGTLAEVQDHMNSLYDAGLRGRIQESPIPEPTGFALALGAAGMLLARRRSSFPSPATRPSL